MEQSGLRSGIRSMHRHRSLDVLVIRRRLAFAPRIGSMTVPDDRSSVTVLGDLVSRDRRSNAPALSVPGLGREYDYRRFCTITWKLGNFLRHCGVHDGSTVGIVEADTPRPEPLFAFFGAALLGGIAQFYGSTDTYECTGTRAVLVPVEHAIDPEALPRGSKQIVYGGSPADCDPSVGSFERDVWSENPTEPPDHVTPNQPVLRASGETYTHAELLDRARSLLDQSDNSTNCVPVRSLRSTETVVAGVIAPLLVGKRIILSEG